MSYALNSGMEIIATNIGKKKLIQYNGKEVYTGMYKYPVNEALHLEKNDVLGDDVIDRKYHGGADKACYLYSSTHYDFWKPQYPDIEWQWGMFGENLSIADLNEQEVFIGDIYQLGTALVQVTQPRQPCYKLGIRLQDPSSVKAFVKAEKPGVYIRILKEGTVSAGDSMTLVERKKESFSIQYIFHLIYNAPENIDAVKQAIQIPELAASCKKDLIKYAKL